MLQRLVRPTFIKRLCHTHSKTIFHKNINTFEERLCKQEEKLHKQEEQIHKLNETLEEIAIHLYGGICLMSIITIISMNN